MRDLTSLLQPQSHNQREPTTRRFTWNITSGLRRPDGVLKEVILVNDKFPGPTLEGRSGDTWEIDVYNNHHEGIAIHWHGLHMRGANHMDGAVGITQCEVPPGEHFVYHFKVGDNQTGTYWYHAHSQTQLASGLYGGLVVHADKRGRPQEDGYDMELLFLVGDWYHRRSSEVLKTFMDATSNGDEPCPDSLLVNGLGHFDCSRSTPSAPVDCDVVQKPTLALNMSHRYLVRLVNTGSLTGFSFTIPDAEVNITSVDGDQAVTADPSNGVGILYPGERVDFILSWQQAFQSNSSSLVVNLDKEQVQFPMNFQSPNLALEYHQEFTIDSTPKMMSRTKAGLGQSLETSAKQNLQKLKVKDLTESLPEPEVKLVIYSAVEILNHLNNIPTGFINRTHWSQQEEPLLSLERSEWDDHQLVPWTAAQPKWVELVINNLDSTGHPFHLHGFDFYVISSWKGQGGWDYFNPFDTSSKPRGGDPNLKNPIRKDTVYVPAFGYVRLRFWADNEGIWLLHCHILWHEASGMAMAIHVLGDEDTAFKGTVMGQESSSLCR
ncbi:multicopper oxidase-domain-containing protein [Coniella lustricola]|uniref:Multicopper oxidase-domain-containing protein n=1 Tax=Coniella lustricola TaxID=2025994 RepID=A0A2T3A466_9PEZI|nr:multicopper oxidase-domain-containing protein [Coniella lustricola]